MVKPKGRSGELHIVENNLKVIHLNTNTINMDGRQNNLKNLINPEAIRAKKMEIMDRVIIRFGLKSMEKKKPMK